MQTFHARMSLAAYVATVSLGLCPAMGQTVWYVEATATGGNDGTSWADAFIDLQDGLAVAESTDQIWVAAGTYRPSANPAGSRAATFGLTGNVGLYGGFAGDVR